MQFCTSLEDRDIRVECGLDGLPSLQLVTHPLQNREKLSDVL